MWILCEKGMNAIRRMLAGLLSCPGVFIVGFLVVSGVLAMDWPIWYSEPLAQIRAYMLVPWGAGLGMLCIVRRSERKEKFRLDFFVLTMLLLWIVVPFGWRFGFTFNNVNSWHNAFVAFVGIYMMTAMQDRRARAQNLDAACVGVLLVSLVWGGLLLLCAGTATSIDLGAGGYGFGVQFQEYGCLCGGMHYNTTAMIAVCCSFMNMCGFARSKFKVIKAIYALGMAMMIAVVVLTQSRTGRYALLAAMAFGVFSWCFQVLKEQKRVLRIGASLCLAAFILVGGFIGADLFTKAAIESYQERGVMSAALAEGNEQAVDQTQQGSLQARDISDTGLSGRMDIWKNTVSYWMDNPKHFLIGCGVGKIGSRIVQGTIHESIGAVQLHNGYLQFMADYGIVGFALLAAFLMLQIRGVWMAFFGNASIRGHRAMGMLVLACLMTGMMESTPIAPLGLMNAFLFYALGHMVSGVRDGCPDQE